jgi:hypothetical protein
MAENAEIKVDSAQEVPEVKPVEEPVKQEEPLQTEEKEAEKKTKRTTPCKLGYCIFNSAEELVQYFKMLMKDCPKHADMNEVRRWYIGVPYFGCRSAWRLKT